MIEEPPARKLDFFGVALDPTDDGLKLGFKAILGREFAAGRLLFRNPYEAFTGVLCDLIEQGVCEAYEAGATILVVACPICTRMLSDALKTEGLEGTLRLANIADIVMEAGG